MNNKWSHVSNSWCVVLYGDIMPFKGQSHFLLIVHKGSRLPSGSPGSFEVVCNEPTAWWKLALVILPFFLESGDPKVKVAGSCSWASEMGTLPPTSDSAAEPTAEPSVGDEQPGGRVVWSKLRSTEQGRLSKLEDAGCMSEMFICRPMMLGSLPLRLFLLCRALSSSLMLWTSLYCWTTSGRLLLTEDRLSKDLRLCPPSEEVSSFFSTSVCTCRRPTFSLMVSRSTTPRTISSAAGWDDVWCLGEPLAACFLPSG